MRDRHTRWYTRRIYICLGSLVALVIAAGPAWGNSSYRSTEGFTNSVEVASETRQYAPNMLSVTFGSVQEPDVKAAEEAEVPADNVFEANLLPQPQTAQPASAAASAPVAETAPQDPLVTPEPGSLTLIGLGLGALALLRKRRGRQ